ncbi:hypothetical protein ACFP1L_12165 [Lactiplantibacillus nangangensis]|uniref:Cell surface protein n=1 Tax=Lactiplantibacillus nangangensis TaxID=2559917 RepID=A0ABW1SM50_9LACO|nr:hypothetical protein [Lactiplantibacillus nangangensis]
MAAGMDVLSLMGGEDKLRDIDVNLTSIKDALPLKLGFYFPTENPDVGTMYYDLGYFAAGEPILKPTIDATLTKDSVKITGKGTSGNLVTNSVTTDTETVGRNGVYQFDLKKGELADYLAHNDRVTVTESNDTGDTGIAELKKLSIAAIEQDPTFDLEDSLKLGGSGDEPDLDQVTNFIVDQLKLRTGEATTAKFAIDYEVISQAELVKSIKAFNDNQLAEIKIPIYATEPGYMQSNTLNVKVTHDAQGLAFGQTMTTLDFGQHEVPMVSKTFYPIKSWSIIVHDHRKNKSAWNIKARLGSVTPKSAADSLAGYLWYQAPNQTDKIRLSDTDVQIFHQSADTKSADTVIPFKSESTGQTADSGLHQLFVQAGPTIAAGEKKTTINWTLENAP